jgi:hypothetical protein
MAALDESLALRSAEDEFYAITGIRKYFMIW